MRIDACASISAGHGLYFIKKYFRKYQADFISGQEFKILHFSEQYDCINDLVKFVFH